MRDPVCGMDLEPKIAFTDDEENSKPGRILRRFRVGLTLTLPVVILAMKIILEKSGYYLGRVKEKSAPAPGVASAVISPPCR
jgi:hypothetical protein